MGGKKKKKDKVQASTTADSACGMHGKARAKELKRQRQEAKANQKLRKERKAKGVEFPGDEEDISEIVERLDQQLEARETVVFETVLQPSPRAHSSFTLLPNHDVLIFGGERYDGQRVHVYGDVTLWSPDKNDWRKVISPLMPKARCSHQAVLYNDSVYVFGGEYSTFYQFFHFKDFWRFSLKTHRWEKIQVASSAEVPQARSGHRMVVWRNLLILFGGFHDTTRETRYFNDLYVYSFVENRWRRVDFPPHALVPAARSGCLFFSFPSRDCVLLHGGFAKIQDTARKVQGKTYTDTWLLDVKALASDWRKNIPSWERIRNVGAVPSARTGMSGAVYRHSLLVFGGVSDEDNGQVKIKSVFFNDLYSFDIEKKRWYELSLRNEDRSSTARTRTKEKRLQSATLSQRLEGAQQEEDKACSDSLKKRDESVNCSSEDEENTFAYFDEKGRLVRIAVHFEDAEVSTTDGSPAFRQEQQSKQQQQKQDLYSERFGASLRDSTTVDGVSVAEAAAKDFCLLTISGSKRTEEQRQLSFPVDSNSKQPKSTEKQNSICSSISSSCSSSSCSNSSCSNSSCSNSSCSRSSQGSGKQTAKLNEMGARVGGKAASSVEQSGDCNKKSQSQQLYRADVPLPRLHGHMIVRGTNLLLYGGLLEIGDQEITLDDCWKLNLSTRKKWERVLKGTMDEQEWLGDADEDTEGSSSSSESDSCSSSESDSDEDAENSNSSGTDTDSSRSSSGGESNLDCNTSEKRCNVGSRESSEKIMNGVGGCVKEPAKVAAVVDKDQARAKAEAPEDARETTCGTRLSSRASEGAETLLSQFRQQEEFHRDSSRVALCVTNAADGDAASHGLVRSFDKTGMRSSQQQQQQHPPKQRSKTMPTVAAVASEAAGDFCAFSIGEPNNRSAVEKASKTAEVEEKSSSTATTATTHTEAAANEVLLFAKKGKFFRKVTKEKGKNERDTKAAAERSYRQEIEALREKYNLHDSDETPQEGETLRCFFDRTRQHWLQVVVNEEKAKQATAEAAPGDSKLEVLRDHKELKRAAFAAAAARHQELLPCLQRLDELQRLQWASADSSNYSTCEKDGSSSSGKMQQNNSQKHRASAGLDCGRRSLRLR